MIESWSIIPRERDLSRRYDPISGWSRLVLVERDHSPWTWTVTAPSEHLEVFQAGSGCLLYEGRKQVVSGRLTRIKRGAAYDSSRDKMVDTTTLSFADDRMPLGARIIFPTPGHNLTATISNFPNAYDLRTGIIEDLIVGYIRSHIGDLAQADRQLSRLRVPASLGRGGTTQVSARLDNLGVLVGSLAEAANLVLSVEHTEDSTGAWLDLRIQPVRDLSADIRFGDANSLSAGVITEWEYEISAPTATRPIIAGGGELAARDFLQLDDLDSENLWGMAFETLVDQRHVAPDTVDKQAELTRAAREALVEGAGPTRVAFIPMLGPDLRWRRDLRIGDIVGYDLPGLGAEKDKIREATTVVSAVEDEATVRTSIVVGTPDAPSARSQQQTARALREINVIKRSK